MIKKINLLDDYTINKIAAGEVVERPSSVVKELVENSIDANASKITIEIQDGGKQLIRITDNGDGISSSEVEKSFLRHATSKIIKIDDLYDLHSLGFRGEAMASIASVSKIELISRTNEEKIGTKISLEGGNIINKEPVGTALGTTIIVKDLFFNTLPRQKFLKSSSAETIHITDIVNKLSIGHNAIQFKLINNNKIMLTTPGDSNLKNAVRSLYGKEISDNLIPISIQTDYLKLDGFIGNNTIYRSNKSLQHIYVNGRYVKSKLIQNAILEGYKSIVPINKHAICFLNLYLDPRKIDVNIHPTKLEIKFEEEEKIFKLIKEEINSLLLQSSLIPKYERKDIKEKRVNKQTYIHYDKDNIINRDDLLNNFHIDKDVYKDKPIIEKQIDLMDTMKEKEEVYEQKKDISNVPINSYEKNTIITPVVDEKDISIIKEEKKQLPKFNVIGTLFNTYIISQYKESMFLIDQHAAHERILYEKYMKKFHQEDISSQILLDPIILELSKKDMLVIENKLDIFQKFGFEVELFGNNSIVVRSVPNIFGGPESEKFLLEIIDNIDDLSHNYELKKDKIATMACKSAIKAHDRIQNIEIDNLLNNLKECNNSYTCPHGRPIIVEMKKYEIEKMFKRIM